MMYQQLRRLYQVREVPPEENSMRTVLVFEDEKATKKGGMGLYSTKEVRRTGKFYDVTLRGTRGTTRLSQKEFDRLGLVTSGIPMIDPNGDIVQVEN